MTEAQRVWLENFLRASGAHTQPPGTQALTEAPDDAGTPSGGGGSAAPAPAPLADKQKADRAMGQLRARYAQVKNSDQTFETQQANQAYASGFNAFVDAWTAKDYTKAAELADAAEKALKTLEDAIAEVPKKQQAAADEAKRVGKLGDADLNKLSPADRAAIIRKLLGGGQPGADARAAQFRLYDTAQIDPAFKKLDDDRGNATASAFKADPALRRARDGWGAMSPEQKVRALEPIVAAQSKNLGIPAPKLFIDAKLPTGRPGPGGTTQTVNGKYDETDGMLHLNPDPASTLTDFQKAIELVLHENAHHYQIELVARLKDGKLKAGDPEYAQAQMFAANRLVPGGYIPDSENFQEYEKQPIEAQAADTGGRVAKSIVAGL